MVASIQRSQLMLDQAKAESLFKTIKSFASVPEVEVIFYSTNYSLTRFANNTIHQNVSELNEIASIRVAFDGKTARATTNRFDAGSLKRAVQSAESIARVQEPDPERLPLVKLSEDGKGKDGGCWFERKAVIRMGEGGEGGGKMVRIAEKQGVKAEVLCWSWKKAEVR